MEDPWIDTGGSAGTVDNHCNAAPLAFRSVRSVRRGELLFHVPPGQAQARGQLSTLHHRALSRQGQICRRYQVKGLHLKNYTC